MHQSRKEWLERRRTLVVTVKKADPVHGTRNGWLQRNDHLSATHIAATCHIPSGRHHLGESVKHPFTLNLLLVRCPSTSDENSLHSLRASLRALPSRIRSQSVSSLSIVLSRQVSQQMRCEAPDSRPLLFLLSLLYAPQGQKEWMSCSAWNIIAAGAKTPSTISLSATTETAATNTSLSQPTE